MRFFPVLFRVLISGGVFGLAAGSLFGSDRGQQSQLTLYWENDIFARSDRQYTNGFKFSWLSADMDDYELTGWSETVVGHLPFINRPGVVRNLGLSFGQEIYTPDDIRLPNPPQDDRPYAGWLYAGISFHSKTLTRTDIIEFNVGVIGPLSLAEETQKTIHSIFGADRPEGWDHQLKTEPGILGLYERKWRAGDYAFGEAFRTDFIPHVGAGVGNVAVYGSAGGMVRYGYNLPRDFGTNPLRRPGDVPLPADDGAPRPPFGVHLFAGVDGRYVAHDIFLDGNTFRDSRSVERRPWVAELNGGLGFEYRDFRATYSIVYRTRQFESQDRSLLFGSISATVPF